MRRWNINISTFGTCSNHWPALISIQERRWMPFCESKWPNDLEGDGQCLPFQIPAARIPRCIFGANLGNLAQIHQKLSRGQSNFLEFWVKMAKMTLKVKVNDPYFQYQPRVSLNVSLVQIWWFRLKSVTSYRADRVKFTDGTDRRTDAGNDNTPSALGQLGVKKSTYNP